MKFTNRLVYTIGKAIQQWKVEAPTEISMESDSNNFTTTKNAYDASLGNGPSTSALIDLTTPVPSQTAAPLSTQSAESILQMIQKTLPTCHRCRSLRRKCDTQLPSCRMCKKAGAECAFYDHALKQTLPRAVSDLKAVKNGTVNSSTAALQIVSIGRHPEPAMPKPFAPSSNQIPSKNSALDTSSVQESSTTVKDNTGQFSFDVLIPSGSVAGKARYWGASSVFALTVEILHHAVACGFIKTNDLTRDLANPTRTPGVVREMVFEGYTSSNDIGASTYSNMGYNAQNSTSGYYTRTMAPDHDIRDLVQLYLVSLNTLYGFVDPAEIPDDLQTYLRLRYSRRAMTSQEIPTAIAAFPPASFSQSQNTVQASSIEIHRYFRISMMCAISCVNESRYLPHRAAESLSYYADAVSCVEEVTSEASASSLQALLLLIVFCLFYPRKGDIWKLLDYACRLTVELGYHTEPQIGRSQNNTFSFSTGAVNGIACHSGNDTGPSTTGNSSAYTATTTGSFNVETAGETEAQRKLRRSTFWGLYAIERIVGQLFGRGSDLPETIITTEYPSSLHMGSSLSQGQVDLSGIDQPTLQDMSIAHHYRLVYLRSEIFRSIYLPATTQDPTLEWLKVQYTTLHAWRKELAVRDDLEGVATVTCDVGYDATICFLFQPMLLRALNTAAAVSLASSAEADISDSSGNTAEINPEVDNGNPCIILASDPFHCAVGLIRMYEKVIRAPRLSSLGSYPMTFLSAHYIYLASSTLIAYVLLRLGGRLKILKRMSYEDTITEGDTEDLDWGSFVDVSGSCLILLAWCSERWPEMVDMLDVHKKLFNRAIRGLISQKIVN